MIFKDQLLYVTSTCSVILFAKDHLNLDTSSGVNYSFPTLNMLYCCFFSQEPLNLLAVCGCGVVGVTEKIQHIKASENGCHMLAFHAGDKKLLLRVFPSGRYHYKSLQILQGGIREHGAKLNTKWLSLLFSHFFN